ncbi:MAG: type IV secretory system conjugative DNA transfer family protein, partial [bacterium]
MITETFLEIRPLETALGWDLETERLKAIKQEDRNTHFYIIGASGVGKTKFLEYLIWQDIIHQRGFGIIDPTGDLIRDVKEIIFKEEIDPERVVIIDLKASKEKTPTFNPLEKLPNISPSHQAKELVSAFKKIWIDSWGPRMEDLLKNTFIALIEAELTLAEVPLFLTHGDFRRNVLSKTSHPITREYFQRFERLADKTKTEWVESTLNKIDAFLIDDEIRDLISLSKSSFNLRKVMDNKKILLINLDKGKFLKEDAFLLGSLFLSKIWMATLSRSEIPESQRTPFYLYIDEFQNFATQDFIESLSEARKYGLSLTMVHQNLSQLSKELQGAILGNCGLQACFRVARQDAEILAKEFFQTTGLDIKTTKFFSKSIDDIYYTYQEEWERYFQGLQNLSERMCYVKHKKQGGIILIHTINIDISKEGLGYLQIEFPYLKSRQE